MGDPVTKEIIQADLKTAMKSGDHHRVSTLRYLLSAVKNKEIDLRRSLDSAELCAVISSGIKKCRESIEGFEKGGRPELVQASKAEMAILQAYLPPVLTEAELAAIIDEAVKETGAKGAKDTGAVMKWVMPKVSGRADGRVVSQMVKEKLS